MSKHRHSKDKMYMSRAQLVQSQKDRMARPEDEPLPFNFCMYSLTEFAYPCCTRQGHVFDLLKIVPYLRKHHANPLTGAPLQPSQLIKLNFHKNEHGQYYDPVTLRSFHHRGTKLVAIASSGNVYLESTVKQLNTEAKMWRDLLTDVQFKAEQIIPLGNYQQAPKIDSASVDKIMALKRQAPDRASKELQPSKTKKFITQSRSIQYLVQEAVKKRRFTHKTFSTVQNGARATCSSFDFTNSKDVYRGLNSDQIRQLIFNEAKLEKAKSIVLIQLNIGTVTCQLFDYALPKAVYSFIQLAEKQTYTGLASKRATVNQKLAFQNSTVGNLFGKAIKQKTIQLHCRAGLLSLPSLTSTSEFSITLASCKKYDADCVVFGEVIQGVQLLQVLNNRLARGEKARVTVERVQVVQNCLLKLASKLLVDSQQRPQRKLANRLLL